MGDIWKYDPGSPEAIKHGCTCSPVLNRGGKGIPGAGPQGWPLFTGDPVCPLHGVKAMRAKIARGSARFATSSDKWRKWIERAAKD